jgi:hypothetical protein
MTKTDMKPKITAKNIIRTCALIAILFFFIPTVTVSCAGKKETLSASRIMSGVEYQGTKYSSAHPVLIILLLLPAVIFAVWSVKALHDKERAKICAGCSLIDTAGWSILYFKCRELEDAGFSVRMTWAYYFNLIVLSSVFGLSLLALLGKVSMTDPIPAEWPESAGKLPPLVRKKMKWKCPSCGRDNEGKHAFCSECGTARPGPACCPECGEPLMDGAMYCGHCGKRIDETGSPE